ncbi:MAG: RDD family protein [Nocardioidaceae bacterium]
MSDLPPPPPPPPGQPPSDQPPGYGYNAPPPPPSQPGVPRPAELLDRFLARLIDGVVVGVAYGILGAVLSPIFLHGFYHSRGEVFVYVAVLSVVFTVLTLGYFAFLESSRGQTVGKMVMKLRTVGPTGQNPTLEQAVRRNIFYAINLLRVVPVLGPLVAGVGGLVAVIMIAVGINNDTVNRQAWHDHFAGGTRVLKIG